MAANNPTGKAILRASSTSVPPGPADDLAPGHGDDHRTSSHSPSSPDRLALALGHTGMAVIVALACGSVVATAATVIFNVALVFAATDRIEGRTPTIGGSLAQAWGRRKA